MAWKELFICSYFTCSDRFRELFWQGRKAVTFKLIFAAERKVRKRSFSIKPLTQFYRACWVMDGGMKWDCKKRFWCRSWVGVHTGCQRLLQVVKECREGSVITFGLIGLVKIEHRNIRCKNICRRRPNFLHSNCLNLLYFMRYRPFRTSRRWIDSWRLRIFHVTPTRRFVWVQWLYSPKLRDESSTKNSCLVASFDTLDQTYYKLVSAIVI